MTLPNDPVALATCILSSGRLRAILGEVSLDQIVAVIERLWELDRVAQKSAAYLAAQSADRAAFLFVAPSVTAAHDELAEALIGLGYAYVRDIGHAE